MTHRERLEKAINNMEKTSVCLDVFDRAIAEQQAEIERLKAELSQRTNLEGPAPCWNSDHMKEIAALKAQLATAKREVWAGLKIDNSTLRWALKELGPTGTNAEAYIKATVEYVIACRDEKEHS